MAAYIVVDLTPTDADKLSNYSTLAANTLIPFDGEFVAKGPITALHGESSFKVKVIIQFPDRLKAEAWYQSDAYQEIIPIREQGMRSQFHLIA